MVWMVCKRRRRPSGAAGAITTGAYDMCPLVGAPLNPSTACVNALTWKGRIQMLFEEHLSHMLVQMAPSLQVRMACN